MRTDAASAKFKKRMAAKSASYQFVHDAAKVSEEPKLPEAAKQLDVRFAAHLVRSTSDQVSGRNSVFQVFGQHHYTG
jgi:hypothetical protein